MASNGDDVAKTEEPSDGGATSATSNDDVDVDLAAKFSSFCDVRTKDHFTSKACNKLVKDCFDGHYKFKNIILTNRVDSSVFSKCKEKGKPWVPLYCSLKRKLMKSYVDYIWCYKDL